MTNSKIGKQHLANGILKMLSDEDILVEAAYRRGESNSIVIKPQSPSLQKISLSVWKQARAAALNADFPNMNPMYEIYDDTRIDLFLSSSLNTRILKLQQAKFNLVDDKGKPDFEAKKLFEKQWFLDFQKIAMEKIYEGYMLPEFTNIDEKGEVLKCVAVNKYHVKAHKGIVVKNQFDDEGQSYLEPPYNAYYLPIGEANDMGLLYKVVPIILAIKYAIGQWNEFNEKLGIPFRTVTTRMANTERQKQLGLIMDQMGSAGWAVLNEGEEVKLMEMSQTNPHACFKELIHILDARIATYLLGQSGTSNPSENKGTYGSMQILQEITAVIHESDLTAFKYLFNDQLKPLLLNLSPVYKPLEKLFFDWDKSVELTVQETVDYIVKLSDVYDIDEEFVTQKTGIPVTKKKAITGKQTVTAAAKKKRVDSSRLNAFYQLDAHGCCNVKTHIKAAATPNFTPDVLRIAKLIFDGKQKGYLDQDLIKLTADHLLKGILSGYKPITEDSDEQDINMLKGLSENVYVFSAFKTYETLRAITDKLLDDNGDVRSWSSFKKEVLKIDNTYNQTYLKAEYDNAIVSSQQASQWMDIQATKATLPLLKFVATLDDRTTDICNGLNDVTLPADHEFWQTHFLPLHWHERSLIQQLASGTITDLSQIIIPKLAPMFNTNVGVTGVAFPDTHPYYEVSQAAKKTIIKEVKKIMPEDL